MRTIRALVLACLISAGSSFGMVTKAVLPILPVELWTRILWHVVEQLDGALTHKIFGALTLQRLNRNASTELTLSNILTRISPTAQDVTLFLQKNFMKIPIGIGKVFITHGADLNTPQDSDDNTLVHLAAIHGEADKLKTLIALGACTNKKNKWGQIAIMCVTASQRQIREIFRLANPELFVN